MSESFKTRLMRTMFHIHPAYHGTGGRLTYISADWSEVRLEIPHNWQTRNYVGSIFGGSLYGAVDPMFMIMLISVWVRNISFGIKLQRSNLRNPGSVNCMLVLKFLMRK